MSRSLAEIERLAVAPFILLVAVVAGAIQALPVFLHLGSVHLPSARLAQIVLAMSLAVLNWTGAALLWWFAVRRRQYSIWLTAIHVTVALAAGDLLMNGLGYAAASIETHGEYAVAFAHALPSALPSPLGIALLRSPFWFMEALVLIAVGRLVLHMDSLVAPAPVTHLDPVT